MKAINVSRVSTEEQKEAGNSLPAQIERVKSYCNKKSFPIVRSFSFDESAYKDKRDEFDKLLEYVQEVAKKEKVAVCFDKVDRLSRSVFDKRVGTLYELALADKIELHFVSDGQIINNQMSAVEKFQFGMSLGLAKYYSDAISDNVKRAFEQKLRNGEWIGQPRVGYISTLEGDKKGFSLDPEKAHLVRKMFELYATSNFSIKTLQVEISKRGLNGRSGKCLSPSMIHKILTDKFYIGIMTTKGREYPHKYATIVPKSVFEHVQSILASYNKKTIKYASKPFALRGLVHCEKCDGTITAELKVKKNNPNNRYIYYSCSNFKGQCERVWIREEELLKPIKKILGEMRMSQKRIDTVVTKLKEINENKNEFHEKAIRQLRTEYDRLQGNLDRMIDLRIEGSITQEMYDKKLTEYKEKQYDINIKMEEYTRADENFHIVANTVLSLSNRALEIFESSEVDEKQQLLNFLLQNCRLSGKNLSFELKAPFNVIHGYAHHSTVLPLVNKLRTFDWKLITLHLQQLPSQIQLRTSHS